MSSFELLKEVEHESEVKVALRMVRNPLKVAEVRIFAFLILFSLLKNLSKFVVNLSIFVIGVYGNDLPVASCRLFILFVFVVGLT